MICNESRSEWKPRAACTPWPVISWMGRVRWVIVVAWLDEVEDEEEEGLGQAFCAKKKKKSIISSEKIWKMTFSFRTEVGVKRHADLMPKLQVPHPQKESLVLDRHWQEMDAKLAKLRERVEQNLWTEDNNRRFQPDSREMPLARKRKAPEK